MLEKYTLDQLNVYVIDKYEAVFIISEQFESVLEMVGFAAAEGFRAALAALRDRPGAAAAPVAELAADLLAALPFGGWTKQCSSRCADLVFLDPRLDHAWPRVAAARGDVRPITTPIIIIILSLIHN